MTKYSAELEIRFTSKSKSKASMNAVRAAAEEVIANLKGKLDDFDLTLLHCRVSRRSPRMVRKRFRPSLDQKAETVQ